MAAPAAATTGPASSADAPCNSQNIGIILGCQSPFNGETCDVWVSLPPLTTWACLNDR